MNSRWATGISVLLAACGPSVLVDTGAQDGGSGPVQTDDGGATSGVDPSPDPPDPVPPEPAGTTTSAGAVDSSDDGNPFIVDVDAGKIYECKLGGDDCARGEKCVPYSQDGGSGWNATKCVPIDPDPAGLGDACEQELFNGAAWTGNDNCGDDAVCFDWDPDAPGVCKGLCEGGLECQEPGTVPYVGCQSCFCICETPCDPLANDCPNDTMCVVTSEIAICVTDASGDAGAYQDPCEFVNVCDPGLFCAASDWVPGCDTSTAGCCTPYCDTQAPDCPDGTTCEPLYDEGGAPETLQFVGMCLAQT